jgi:esterase
MELFYRKMGKGKPLIILHGLYGSSDNWYTIGKHLSDHHEVFLVDLRNHGYSPHHPVHTYDALKDDLHEFIVQHALYKPVLLGHSMGGRVAMFFTAMHPKLAEKIIVVDISPCSYHTDHHPSETMQHATIIRALQSLDITKLTSRKDADEQLAEKIKSTVIRQFLLKNLKTDNAKNYYWCLNLNALEKGLQGIYIGLDTIRISSGIPMDMPALFIRGQLSGYIGDTDLDCIKRYYKNAAIVTIPGAGHWLHAEKPELLLQAVGDFLKD